jgi:iron complex transport system substrate-binding protein
MRYFAALLFIAFTLLSACGGNTAEPTADGRTFTDGLGREVVIPENVTRVVSLAPSVTEMIFAAGGGGKLVGVTSFCNYPEQAKDIKKIGDTQTPNLESIMALRPQVVFVTTASPIEAFVKKLASQNITVFVSDPKSVEAVEADLRQYGEILGTRDAANEAADKFRERFDTLAELTKNAPHPKVFIQVSREPLYTNGKGSYMVELIEKAGGDAVTKDVPSAFPKLSEETALAMDPEVIILSASGDNTEPNSALRNSKAVKNGRVYSINADILARPGPRLADAAEEMARLVHPELFANKTEAAAN